MKYVVAVSGGVDSVVLLDMLVQSGDHELVVAHFDHGIRESSAADARFVAELAAQYGVVCEMRREELGIDVGEDEARQRRYVFLHDVTKKHQAKLVTAHHLDDLVETIALNVRRGTRWRGLACMSDERVERPLLNRTKSELVMYACERRLEWVEDETNRQDVYSRNRIRRQLASLPFESKRALYDLWQQQGELKKSIKGEIATSDFPVLNRYFMTMSDMTVARELLYDYLLDQLDVSLLSKQLEYLLLAIKTGRAGTKWDIGQGVTAHVGAKDWRAEMREQ